LARPSQPTQREIASCRAAGVIPSGAAVRMPRGRGVAGALVAAAVMAEAGRQSGEAGWFGSWGKTAEAAVEVLEAIEEGTDMTFGVLRPTYKGGRYDGCRPGYKCCGNPAAQPPMPSRACVRMDKGIGDRWNWLLTLFLQRKKFACGNFYYLEEGRDLGAWQRFNKLNYTHTCEKARLYRFTVEGGKPRFEEDEDPLMDYDSGDRRVMWGDWIEHTLDALLKKFFPRQKEKVRQQLLLKHGRDKIAHEFANHRGAELINNLNFYPTKNPVKLQERERHVDDKEDLEDKEVQPSEHEIVTEKKSEKAEK